MNEADEVRFITIGQTLINRESNKLKSRNKTKHRHYVYITRYGDFTLQEVINILDYATLTRFGQSIKEFILEGFSLNKTLQTPENMLFLRLHNYYNIIT